MIRILIILVGLTTPIHAAEQYSEAACILIVQQLQDYERRHGKDSQLYHQTQVNHATHCKNPKPSHIKKDSVLSNDDQTNKNHSTPLLNSRDLKSGDAATNEVKPRPTSLRDNLFEIIGNLLFLLLSIVIFSIVLILIRNRLFSKKEKSKIK